MPAKDKHHDTVIRTLNKAGWRIVSEQVTLLIDGRHLWIDIQAEDEKNNSVILVEVKGFENIPSPIEYLAAAVGKYLLYQAALEANEIAVPLYLAVPLAGYNGVLSEEIGIRLILKNNIRVMVFDPDDERIVQWID